MENTDINKSISENESYLKNKIGESFDTKYRHLGIQALNNADALVVYISGLIDARAIDDTILEPLMKISQLPKEKFHLKTKRRLSELIDYGIFTAMVSETNTWSDVCDAIMEGDTVLFVDQFDSALILSTRKYDSRSVEEPTTESEIRAPRDGFVENIQTNAALIRRRIKDYELRFDNMKIGERTKTVVSIVYIRNLVNDSLLKEVKIRLERIKVDGILESSYIEELIEDASFSMFPQIANTERPDKASAALLEGRIVILVDNTPFALIIPAVFWQFMISSGDYYQRFRLGTVIRWIRVIALILSISLTPLYVLLTSFHQEMLPTVLALAIAENRSGVPFPAIIEAFTMEIVLEIMKEAGLRMPKPIGQTVSIVGTLVIGEAAVTAGLVAPLLVIVIALAAISSYVVPSYNMNNALRFVRFPLLILTAMFGLLGFLGGLIILDLHVMSLRSFGTPYLAPIVPFEKNGLKDTLVRYPWWKMTKRSNLARPKDETRQASNLKPEPPAEK